MPHQLTSINPATLELVGRVPVTPAKAVTSAVETARRGFSGWKSLDLSQRAKRVRTAQQLLLERGPEISRLITQEMGRPLAESLGVEISASADLMGYYAGKARAYLGDHRVPLHFLLYQRRESRHYYEPLGVMGIISPWNWPLLIPLGGIVPALLAGNSVVFKPSEITPLTGQAIRQLFLDAGVPEGVFQIIQGGADTGHALVESSVDKLFFTGSTRVGHLIYQQAAKQLKKCVLEMGGSDAAIICGDADVESATSGVLWGGFCNAGQNCNSIERVFVHRSLANAFIQRLSEKMARLTVGDGLNPETDMGPLASKEQFEKLKRLVKKCHKEGHEILSGGQTLDDLNGYFMPPAMILRDKTHVSEEDEEIFGPVVQITVVEDDDEAVALANRSRFGLASSVWTRDARRGRAIARQVQAGTVMINDCIVSFGMTEAGWTGIKESGIGWVHGRQGLEEMVNIKYVNRDRQSRQQQAWWFPYTAAMTEALSQGVIFLFSGKLMDKLSALMPVLKTLPPYLLFNRRRKDKF